MVSKWRILIKDYWTCFSLVLGVALAGTGVYMFINMNARLVHSGIILMVSFLSVIVFVKRYKMIQDIFEAGKVTNGLITKKSRSRGEWIVKFEFEVEAQKYKARNVIVGFKFPFNKGDNVAICYNQLSPKQAFIRDVFVSREFRGLDENCKV